MTTPRAGAIGTRRVHVSARTTHLASIVVSALAIGFLGRRQWFFYDDWAFVIPKGPSLLAPHSGHLVVLAELVVHALRAVFGLSTYAPYLACAVATHLLLAHLLWRVMLQSRVEPWIATALAFLLMLFGTGGENIFWAFQLCYMGAMCCGVAVLLLVTRDRLGARGCVGAAVITAIGLGSSGASLPVIAVAIVLSVVFRGLRTTVLIFVLPVALYLLWYVTKPTVPMIATPHGLVETLTFVPQYVGRMFSNGFDVALPVPGIGAVLVVCLAVWVGARASRLDQREYAMPAALIVSALLFAALTGYTRYGIGLAAATSSRYLYVVFALCLPAIGAGASALAGRRIPPRAFVVLLVLAATAYNTGLLVDSARHQARTEQGSRRQVYAALAYTLKHPFGVDRTVPVDSRWAHSLTTPKLLGLYHHGWIKVGHYGPKDMLNALVDITTKVTPVPAGTATGCTPPSTTKIVIPAGSPLTIDLHSAGTVELAVQGSDGLRSRSRVFPKPAGGYRIINSSGHPAILTHAPRGTTYCAAS